MKCILVKKDFIKNMEKCNEDISEKNQVPFMENADKNSNSKAQHNM